MIPQLPGTAFSFARPILQISFRANDYLLKDAEGC